MLIFAKYLSLYLHIFTCTYRGTHTQALMYNQHTRGMETGLAKKQKQNSVHRYLKSKKIRANRASSKATKLFLRSNKSNINQSHQEWPNVEAMAPAIVPASPVVFLAPLPMPTLPRGKCSLTSATQCRPWWVLLCQLMLQPDYLIATIDTGMMMKALPSPRTLPCPLDLQAHTALRSPGGLGLLNVNRCKPASAHCHRSLCA